MDTEVEEIIYLTVPELQGHTDKELKDFARKIKSQLVILHSFLRFIRDTNNAGETFADNMDFLGDENEIEDFIERCRGQLLNIRAILGMRSGELVTARRRTLEERNNDEMGKEDRDAETGRRGHPPVGGRMKGGISKLSSDLGMALRKLEKNIMDDIDNALSYKPRFKNLIRRILREQQNGNLGERDMEWISEYIQGIGALMPDESGSDDYSAGDSDSEDEMEGEGRTGGVIVGGSYAGIRADALRLAEDIRTGGEITPALQEAYRQRYVVIRNNFLTERDTFTAEQRRLIKEDLRFITNMVDLREKNNKAKGGAIDIDPDFRPANETVISFIDELMVNIINPTPEIVRELRRKYNNILRTWSHIFEDNTPSRWDKIKERMEAADETLTELEIEVGIPHGGALIRPNNVKPNYPFGGSIAQPVNGKFLPFF